LWLWLRSLCRHLLVLPCCPCSSHLDLHHVVKKGRGRGSQTPTCPVPGTLRPYAPVRACGQLCVRVCVHAHCAFSERKGKHAGYVSLRACVLVVPTGARRQGSATSISHQIRHSMRRGLTCCGRSIAGCTVDSLDLHVVLGLWVAGRWCYLHRLHRGRGRVYLQLSRRATRPPVSDTVHCGYHRVALTCPQRPLLGLAKRKTQFRVTKPS
jgi:hypothetical protein